MSERIMRAFDGAVATLSPNRTGAINAFAEPMLVTLRQAVQQPDDDIAVRAGRHDGQRASSGDGRQGATDRCGGLAVGADPTGRPILNTL